MNKEAIQKALEILQKRTAYYLSVNDLGRSSAYSSAVDILQYAIDNNTDCLREFDAATPEPLDDECDGHCIGCANKTCPIAIHNRRADMLIRMKENGTNE